MAKTVLMTKNDGRLTFDVELPYVFSLLANGKYTITIKRANEKRSIPQNDLMWMWLTCIERETGTPKDDIYMYYCKKFGTASHIKNEKLEMIDAIEAEINSKTSYSITRCIENMFEGEIFSVRKTGTVEDVERITPEMLYNAYKKALSECTVEIYVVGSVDID